MRTFSFPTFAGALCLGAVFVWQAPAPADDDVPPPPPPENNVVTQARGPVHEAYAEPAETRPEPQPIIAKQPPDPIAELPPDQKPAGDNVEWIPGYWAWDDETTDFTWISGFWRDPPPGRDWTPGHWQQVDGGWQWVSGMWATQNVQQVEYLPPPPPSIDNGPSVPATDAANVYVPGCWVYRETRYLWRPGYWMAANPNWVWIPDHYVWTPVGYVFVGGYWDRPLEGRGLLFAPVRFNRDVYLAQGFVYTPEYVVQPDFLLGALFVRPAYTSYYFGDYFEARYEKRGFTSWVDYRVGRFSYDPNFAYYQWRYRADDHWVASLRDLYALRRSGEVPRPPRTFVQQTQIINKITVNNTENITINKNIHITNIQNVTALTPINKVQNVKITGLAGLTGAKPPAGRPIAVARAIKLEPVPKERRVELQQHVTQLHQFAAAQQREQAKILSTGAIPVKPTDKPKVVKVELPKNPARPAAPRVETRAPAPTAPPPPPAPKHEERPIPPHETPKPSAPPKVQTPAPLPKEPPTPAKEPIPPRKEPVPPPVKEPPMPPRREPVPPAKEPPTPPRKEPPAPVKEPPMPPRREPPPVKEPPMPPRKEPPPPVKAPTPPPVKEAPPPRKEPAPPATPRKEPPPPPAKQPPAKEPPPKDKPPLTGVAR